MKVGVILPLSGDAATPSYAEVRAQALAVEASGLDSVWIYDHLIFRFPEKEPQAVWEGWTVMSALAEATERVELGALVLCTAFRNPAVLAKMAVTLDEVSGGRIVLGLGAGWHQPEFDAFGLPFDHLVDRFEEALKIIVPLVKTGSVDLTGRHHAAPNCAMLPAPTREGGIPVLIASFKPRMLKLTAEYADQWNTAWVGEVSAIDDRRAALEAACAEAGRDPKTLAQTVGINVRFPEIGGGATETPDPAKSLTGSVEEVAAGLRRHAEAGIAHVIADLEPMSEAGINLLAQAAVLSRA
ncbi:MAG: LLM class flavin-dependent oxidoreductase [Solirubrobacteraceae bacterium]